MMGTAWVAAYAAMKLFQSSGRLLHKARDRTRKKSGSATKAMMQQQQLCLLDMFLHHVQSSCISLTFIFSLLEHEHSVYIRRGLEHQIWGRTFWKIGRRLSVSSLCNDKSKAGA